MSIYNVNFKFMLARLLGKVHRSNHVRMSDKAAKIFFNHKVASEIVNAIVHKNVQLVNGESITVDRSDQTGNDISLKLVTTIEDVNVSK